MDIFGGFKETSDVSDVNGENKSEISQEAMNKFEELMRDDKLPENISPYEIENQNDTFENASDKFENLFDSNDSFEKEFCENQEDISEELENDSKEDFKEESKKVQEDSCRIPKNGGEWSGEAGNSKWNPDADTIPGDRNGTNSENKSWKEIKEQYHFREVSFTDGRPDFSEVSKGKVEIEDNWLSKRAVSQVKFASGEKNINTHGTKKQIVRRC